MYCKYCGSQIPDGSRFCRNCGANLAQGQNSGQRSSSGQQQSSNQPQGYGQPYNPNPGQGYGVPHGSNQSYGSNRSAIPDPSRQGAPFQQGDNPNAYIYRSPQYEKRGLSHKQKKRIIVCSAAAAALLVGGVTVFGFTSGFFKRTFSSPESYYSYVELKAASEGADTIGNLYNNLLDSLDRMGDGTFNEISVSLEDGGKSLATAMTGTDLSWIDSIQLQQSFRSDDSTMGSEVEAFVNKVPVLSFHMSADYDLSELYMCLPELSDSYIGVSLDRLYEEASYSPIPAEVLNRNDLISMITDYCPNGETAQKLINRYSELLTSGITQVNKSKGTLTAGSVSQKCTVLETTLNGNDFANIMASVIQSLRTDQEVKRILFAYAEDLNTMQSYGSGYSQEQFYQMFLETLDETESQLSYFRSDPQMISLSSKVWVGKSDKIVGRLLTVSQGNEVVLRCSFAKPQSGKNFGYESSIFYDGETLTITGSGTTSGSKETGSYSIRSDYSELLRMDVADYDTKKAKSGYVSGQITIKPVGDFYYLMGLGGDASAYLNGYSLKAALDTSKDSSKADITVLSSDVPLITLSISGSTGVKGISDIPSGSDPVYNMIYEEEVMKYASSIDWNSLIDSLIKAGLPSEYRSELEEMISYMY